MHTIKGIPVPKILLKANLDRPHSFAFKGDDRWIEQEGLPYDLTCYEIRDDLMGDDNRPYLKNLKELMGVDEEDGPSAAPKLDAEKCQYVKADGKQCGRPRVKGQEFCFQHLPKDEEEEPEAENDPAAGVGEE